MHGIEHNEKTGTDSFVSAGNKVAWHGLGQYEGDDALVAAQVIKGANLDYDVEKIPSVIQLNEKIIPQDKFDLVRTDTGVSFGQVSKNYHILPNLDAFGFFDNIVGGGDAIYQTAGVLGQGEKIFITAKMPSHIRIDGTDDVSEVYVVLTNSHDGKGAVRAMITPIRIVCANTLRMAIRHAKNSVSIQHSSKMEVRLEQAAELLGITNTYVEEANRLLNFTNSIQVSDDQAREIINKLFIPAKDAGLPIADLHGRTKNVLDGVWESYMTGAGQANILGTGYGLYNGITHYLDHGKDYRSEEARFNNVMGGTSYNLGNAAMKEILALS